MTPSRWNWPHVIEVTALALILALAAYLRLANVAANPGWYSDEGTEVDIAAHWLRGEVQYLAIDQSTLIVARLPLFPMLLSAVFRINGVGIESLRWLTGVLGVLSVALLYVYVRVCRRDRALAVIAALLLAIYPAAIVYSRIGFMYNLLTPLGLLAAIGLWQYLDDGRRDRLALAAISIGVGIVSALTMMTFVLPFILIVSARRWRDLGWSLALLVLPLAVYAVAMMIAAPSAFVYDARFTLARTNTIPLLMQPLAVATNLTTLMSNNAWVAPAIVGLFVLRPLRWQWLNLAWFLLPLIALGRTTWLLGGQGMYYLIPLLPYVTLGVATLVRDGVPMIWRTTRTGLSALWQRWRWSPRGLIGMRLPAALASGAALIAIAIVVSPLAISVGFTLTEIRSRLPVNVDELLIDPHDAQQAADFINGAARPDDVVIASPAIAWLLHAHAADFQQAAAADHALTAHFPMDIPADRFAFDPRFDKAKFVVIDNLWRNWAADRMPYVAAMMDQAQHWQLVFRAGEIEIYRRA